MKVGAVSAKLHALAAKLHGVCAKLHAVCAKLHAVRAKLHDVCAKLRGVRAKLHAVCANLHAFAAKLRGVRAKLRGVRAKLHAVCANLHAFAAKLRGVRAKLHGVCANLHGSCVSVHGTSTNVHGKCASVRQLRANGGPFRACRIGWSADPGLKPGLLHIACSTFGFAPQGATACSLGREPQEGDAQRTQKPRRGDGGSSIRGRPPSPLRGSGLFGAPATWGWRPRLHAWAPAEPSHDPAEWLTGKMSVRGWAEAPGSSKSPPSGRRGAGPGPSRCAQRTLRQDRSSAFPPLPPGERARG